jgi:hypothetical protein
MTSIPGTGITFQRGGLHESLGVPEGQSIPPAKMAAALAGKYGPKAKRQAQLAQTLEGMSKGKKKPAAKPTPVPPRPPAGGF